MGNLKSLLVSGYHKLPRAPSFKAVPSSESNTLDNLYRDVSEEWEPPDDDDELMDIKKKKNKIMAKSASHPHRSLIMSRAEQSSSSSSVVKTTSQEEKKTASWWHEQGRSGCFFIESGRERGYNNLVEKMKELEMMDDEYDDMDHVMDVEEVLHHYSRLTCPVYLDIVDKFFMDMYSEFLLPHPSSPSLNNSRRRRRRRRRRLHH